MDLKLEGDLCHCAHGFYESLDSWKNLSNLIPAQIPISSWDYWFSLALPLSPREILSIQLKPFFQGREEKAHKKLKLSLHSALNSEGSGIFMNLWDFRAKLLVLQGEAERVYRSLPF